MSNKSEQTEALKKILEQAKLSPRDQKGYFKDYNFSGDLGDALFYIGKGKIYELKDEIFPYLKDVEPSLRRTAIRALGHGWGKGLNLPEFKDIAYEMWLNDPDKEVKEVALSEWIPYYAGTKEPLILKCLYNISYSDQHTIHARVVALLGVMEVANAVESAKEVHDVFDLERLAGDISKVSGLEDDYDEKINRINMDNIKMFNAAINKGHYYNKINSIMKKYVPNWGK